MELFPLGGKVCPLYLTEYLNYFVIKNYIKAPRLFCIVSPDYYFNNFNISIKKVIDLIKEKFINKSG